VRARGGRKDARAATPLSELGREVPGALLCHCMASTTVIVPEATSSLLGPSLRMQTEKEKQELERSPGSRQGPLGGCIWPPKCHCGQAQTRDLCPSVPGADEQGEAGAGEGRWAAYAGAGRAPHATQAGTPSWWTALRTELNRMVRPRRAFPLLSL